MSSDGNHIATSDMDPAVKQDAALVDDVESLGTTRELSPSPNPEVPQPHRSKTAPPPGMGQDLPDDEDQTTDEAGYTSTPSEPSSCDSSPRSSTHGGILSESPAPVLRRSSSSVEAGSNGIRVQKHLRFTAMDAGSLTMSSEEKHVVFPGEGSRRRKRGVPKDQKWLLSEPATPNLSETADQIRRTISLASLDALIILRNNEEERARVLATVTQAGRELVWRRQDEKKVYPDDAERVFVLAFKRALRSFILAFTTRAGVNLLLVLFRLRKRKLKLRMIRDAIFGEESFRFGAMIGTFTLLNTLTLHFLRLAPPFSYIRRRLRAGLFSKATFGPPQREGSEGERRWQAAAAGAVGSLGLLWETAGRRTGIAQQMFVRGLQASYNQYAPRLGIKIPHGDVLLFGLCCGQIMFGFLLSPDTIPRDYYNWIQSASGVPKHAVASNRTSVRENLIAPAQVAQALNFPGITEGNKASLRLMLEKIGDGWKPGYFIPCAMTHPWTESCLKCQVQRFVRTFRFMLPVYSALHLIPMLVLRRHTFQKDPIRMLLRVAIGISRSCSFLALFVVINQSLFCARSQAMDSAIPSWLRSLLERKENFWAMGFLNALSLFAEEKRRRAELAMYVLPKALESGWSTARRKSWVPIVPFGETILGAAAMAMVMDAYKHQPSALSGIVRKLMFQLVGPV